MPDTGIIQNAFTYSPLDGINVLRLAKHWRGQQDPGGSGQVRGRRREDRRSKRLRRPGRQQRLTDHTV